MNDFQMNFLANDRRNDLLAEADRQRRVHSSPKGDIPARSSKARPRGLRLNLLFGRIAQF